MSRQLILQQELSRPAHLYSRSEILDKPCPVPKSPGVYAWYFKDSLLPEDALDCIQHNGFKLLYIGISPSRPSSRSNLRGRIRTHMRGNASGSTLRLTLGCLLSEKLGIQLRRVGTTERLTFHDGETVLSEWMSKNAFVTWHVCSEPWQVEDELIRGFSLPLNLDKNEIHPFYSVLKNKRDDVRLVARQLPIL